MIFITTGKRRACSQFSIDLHLCTKPFKPPSSVRRSITCKFACSCYCQPCMSAAFPLTIIGCYRSALPSCASTYSSPHKPPRLPSRKLLQNANTGPGHKFPSLRFVPVITNWQVIEQFTLANFQPIPNWESATAI